MMRPFVSAVFFAATALSASALDDLAIAKAALRDGLWEVARVHAANVETNDEAKLVILESFAGENRWLEVSKRLEGWLDVRGDGFDYYRAVVRGDHAQAIRILKAEGSPEGFVEALMYEADRLAEAGSRKDAEALWREAALSTNVSDRVLAVASANLGDVALLRRAYESVRTPSLRQLTGLRLGVALLGRADSRDEGRRLIRAIVNDSPDAEGALEAFLAIADSEISAADWKGALETYRKAIEIWPVAAHSARVCEGRGWALSNLGSRDEALAAFARAEELANDAESRATAILKQGDVLAEMGRGEESMERYRKVLGEYATSKVAARLKEVIAIRERETKGRDLYHAYQFSAARAEFAAVAAADPSRAPQMAFFEVLCLYGQGMDDEAGEKAAALATGEKNGAVRAEATSWLAKFTFNRRDWKAAVRWFVAAAEQEEGERSAESLAWAARAAFCDDDYQLAIQLVTRLLERHPNCAVKPRALIVQGEALLEQARFDEAVLVFEQVSAAEKVPPDDRLRVQMLRADALYAMGADNPSRYSAALEAYTAVRFGGALDASGALAVSFKIARTLEKLHRLDEAIDQYYAHVVLAYRDGRERHVHFDDAARAMFSKAAFRLADEYESRGRDRQASDILELVATSDVPAADEARKRIGKIARKGRFL